MNTILLIESNENAPVACDLSAADNELDHRLDEYRRLFERALIVAERSSSGVDFRFVADPGIAEWCADLALREAGCCPFLGFHLAADDATLVWTTRGDERNEAVQAFLDMFHALASISTSPACSLPSAETS